MTGYQMPKEQCARICKQLEAEAALLGIVLIPGDGCIVMLFSLRPQHLHAENIVMYNDRSVGYARDCLHHYWRKLQLLEQPQ